MKILASTIAATVLSVGLAGPAAADPYLGEIRYFPYNFCPRGWMHARGTVLSIAQNQALFSLIGWAYGGDKRTTFALPNLTNSLNAVTGISGAIRVSREVLPCIAVAGIYPSNP